MSESTDFMDSREAMRCWEEGSVVTLILVADGLLGLCSSL